LVLTTIFCVALFVLVGIPAWIGSYNWMLAKLEYKMIGNVNKIALFCLAPFITIIIGAYGLPVKFLEWLHGR